MSGKLSDEHVETRQVSAKPTFGQKAKRHCARFWWVHLIIFCLLFLIIALCLVYVGMPRIAQHDVDRSYIEFTELGFLDPTPNSVVLRQRSKLHNPSKYTPTLDPFNATMYVVTDGKTATDMLTTIELPELHATKPYREIDIDNQRLMMDNLDQLSEFCTEVLKNENVEQVLKGRTKLHLGALPVVEVDYYEKTSYKGLNGLKGFNVTDTRVNITAAAGTPNMKGNAFIPNPSILTIAMGNVTLTLSTAKAGVVGNSTILNMTLRPGDNVFPMTAFVETTKLASSQVDGVVDLVITGKDSIYNGEHLVYYERALASNNLTLHVNLAQVLKDSAGGD